MDVQRPMTGERDAWSRAFATGVGGWLQMAGTTDVSGTSVHTCTKGQQTPQRIQRSEWKERHSSGEFVNVCV